MGGQEKGRRGTGKMLWRPYLLFVAVGAVLARAGSACVAPPPEGPLETARKHMIERDIQGRGIRDRRVLAAIARVRREAFCRPEERDLAYADGPLPIGYGQTISQPYIVAYMTEALALEPGEKILEIGTGSGYQTAILAEMGALVYSIEIVEPLARRAAEALRKEGYRDVRLRTGDGYLGWSEAAPFDAILLTAAPERVPQALFDQLAPGGRLLAPVGPITEAQELRLYRKGADARLVVERLLDVRFVPMVKGSEAAPATSPP